MLVRGKPAWSVEMLTVLVVLTLIPSWSDGVLLKKCELKALLEAAFSGSQEEMTEDIIVKLTCTVEHISGFNSSLVTTTDHSENRTLIKVSFRNGHDEDHSSEKRELPLTSITNKDQTFPEIIKQRIEPLIARQVKVEDMFRSGGAKVQPKERAVHVDGQENKGLDETTLEDILQTTTKPHRLPDPKDEYYDTAEMPFGPTDLPPDTTTEHIYYDTYEMLFGPTDLPPDRSPDPQEVPLDTYEMLFGPTDLPPDTTTEHIYYDTYEMLFGPTDLPPDRSPDPQEVPLDTYEMLFGPTDKPMNPLDRTLHTIGPLEPETEKRSKRSSEAQTVLYGIFQLSDIACSSGSSRSLNLCGLDCSALTDDDITDDIACLKTLDEKLTVTFRQECRSVDPSQYFSECG